MSMRRGMMAGMCGGDPGHKGFCSLEQIDNGTLVHYMVPVTYRITSPALGFPTPEGETWRQGEGTDAHVHEVEATEWRTVYCRDMAEITKAVEAAHAACQEIVRVAREKGGPAGDAFLAPGAGYTP